MCPCRQPSSASGAADGHGAIARCAASNVLGDDVLDEHSDDAVVVLVEDNGCCDHARACSDAGIAFAVTVIRFPPALPGDRE